MIFAGRRTLHHLHRLVQRNILRAHLRRHASSSTKEPPRLPPPPPLSLHRTIPGPAWAWVDPLLTPLRAYSAMQARSPLTTQLETTLIVYYLGDLCAQTISTHGFHDEGTRYEPLRGLRALVIGAGASIPGYKFFMFLGRNFNFRSQILSLGTKVLISQCCFTPVFNAYFFSMQTLLAGEGVKEAWRRVKSAVPISWTNSWKLWPAVTVFMFAVVPWQFRSGFAGLVGVGWQGYLSWLNRAEEKGTVPRKGGRK